MPVFPWAEIDYRMQHPKKRRAKEEQWRSEEATAQKGARSDVVEVELLSLGQELQHTEVTVVVETTKGPGCAAAPREEPVPVAVHEPFHPQKPARAGVAMSVPVGTAGLPGRSLTGSRPVAKQEHQRGGGKTGLEKSQHARHARPEPIRAKGEISVDQRMRELDPRQQRNPVLVG
mmetsp:Transcript_86745/g.173543  ORF Transcript_86745/g.173543 Transcript_86745/m.173543 type:complete len:175 (+) Transcript_86745:415-939(+)